MNPFNKSSAHHRPIGAGAIYASNTDPGTLDWLKANYFVVNPGAPWGTSIIDTDVADPLRSIGGQAHCSSVQGLPLAIRLPQEGFQTRVMHNGSGCTDGVAVVYDRTTEKPHQLRQYNWNGGAPTAGQYRTWDIRGLGHGTRPGQRLGTSASGMAAMFGVLRGFEVTTPGHRIEHALRMELPRSPGCSIMLSRAAILPAVATDGGATAAGYNTGHIPYGALMALPPTVNLAALPLSDAGLRVAKAIQDYGIYVGDSGGCGAGAIEADQGVSDQIKVQLRRDIEKFYRLMRRVLNNDVLGSPVAGGGNPRAPNCAFDAT